MPLPYRNFNPETDFAPMVHLRQESEAHDQTGEPVTEQELRAQLDLPDHQPERDRWVIPHPDGSERLIAYAMAWLRPVTGKAYLELIVHPGWHRQGLGSSLLAHACQHARSMGANRISVFASQSHPGPGLFLRRTGFKPQGAYTALAGPLPEGLPAPDWPAGWQLRPYSQNPDVEQLAQAMTDCYDGLWGHNEVSPDQMAEWMQRWDPEGLLLVFDSQGQAIGISRVEASPKFSQAYGRPSGYIDAPGWLPPYRSQKNYRQLCLAGMSWLKSRQQEWVVLESWGDAPETLATYQALGLEQFRREIEYVL